jgi:hypothetical protein
VATEAEYRAQLKWRTNNRSKALLSVRRANKKLLVKRRREVHTLLGGKCLRCGFGDYRALQIHHIVAVGGRGFRSVLTDLRRLIKTNGKGVELLCANCHAIEEFERRKTV